MRPGVCRSFHPFFPSKSRISELPPVQVATCSLLPRYLFARDLSRGNNGGPMKMKKSKLQSALLLVLTVVVMLLASRRLPAQIGSCGGIPVMLPFSDVAGNPFFCQIAEAFFTGLTNGTTPTTYSPSQDVRGSRWRPS